MKFTIDHIISIANMAATEDSFEDYCDKIKFKPRHGDIQQEDNLTIYSGETLARRREYATVFISNLFDGCCEKCGNKPCSCHIPVSQLAKDKKYELCFNCNQYCEKNGCHHCPKNFRTCDCCDQYKCKYEEN